MRNARWYCRDRWAMGLIVLFAWRVTTAATADNLRIPSAAAIGLTIGAPGLFAGNRRLGVCDGAPDGLLCDDGNPCTFGEACRSGACISDISLAQPAGSPIQVGASPNSVAMGDFNRDGQPDLAVVNQGSDNVTIL